MTQSRVPSLCMVFWLGVLILSQADAVLAQEREAFSPVQIDFFENKVRPLLVAHCLECHGAKDDKLRGGLRLTSRQEIIEGGDSGAAVIAGDPDNSLLMSAVHYDEFEMPPSGQLPDKEIEVLAEWIRIGLPDPRQPDLVDASEMFDMAAARKHWAFQPRQDEQGPYSAAQLPRVIDQLVEERLNRDKRRKIPTQDERPSGPGNLAASPSLNAGRIAADDRGDRFVHNGQAAGRRAVGVPPVWRAMGTTLARRGPVCRVEWWRTKLDVLRCLGGTGIT